MMTYIKIFKHFNTYVDINKRMLSVLVFLTKLVLCTKIRNNWDIIYKNYFARYRGHENLLDVETI